MYDRAKQAVQNVSNQLKEIPTTTIFNRAKQSAMDATSGLIHLASPETPNYKISATASLAFGLLYLTSSLEHGNFSSYLSMASCAFSTGLAVNQYGVQKTFETLKNGVLSFFKPAKQPVELVVDSSSQHENQQEQGSGLTC